MEKLIFNSPARRAPRKRENPTIRISAEAYDLVESISAETGLSNSHVVSEMVKFAAANATIKYRGDDDED